MTGQSSSYPGSASVVTDEMVDRAMSRFQEAVNSMVMCPRCNGVGYHHGFGEGGHDPDWCDSCGGSQSGPEFSDKEAMREALKAALSSALAQAVQEPDAWQCRFNVSGWLPWHDLDTPIDRFCEKYKFNLDNGTCEMRPLYAHPAAQPSPAADAQRAIDFCQWLQGYFKGDLGRDELSAFEANQIRNELNERVFPGLAVSSTDREGK